MNKSASAVCGRCGEVVGTNDVVGNSGLDPLQVVECGSCGAILDIGGHDW